MCIYHYLHFTLLFLTFFVHFQTLFMYPLLLQVYCSIVKIILRYNSFFYSSFFFFIYLLLGYFRYRMLFLFLFFYILRTIFMLETIHVQCWWAFIMRLNYYKYAWRFLVRRCNTSVYCSMLDRCLLKLAGLMDSVITLVYMFHVNTIQYNLYIISTLCFVMKYFEFLFFRISNIPSDF